MSMPSFFHPPIPMKINEHFFFVVVIMIPLFCFKNPHTSWKDFKWLFRVSKLQDWFFALKHLRHWTSDHICKFILGPIFHYLHFLFFIFCLCVVILHMLLFFFFLLQFFFWWSPVMAISWSSSPWIAAASPFICLAWRAIRSSIPRTSTSECCAGHCSHSSAVLLFCSLWLIVNCVFIVFVW